MIFVGDIAIPDGDDTLLSVIPEELKTDVIANLEGCIIKEKPDSSMSVYNTKKVISFLRENNVKAVSLANNHIQDEEKYFEWTKKQLDNNHIFSFGAGDDEKEARKSVKIESEGETYYLLGYAWEVAGIKNRKRRICVSLLEKSKILADIKSIKAQDEYAQVICYFHWGYELEEYPLPKDRELARAAIDAGACAVIGCHSHCVQGIELYKGKPIVYGLGNFFFPEGIYLGGKLKYPEFAHKELAFEIKNGNYRCHWFQYNAADAKVEYLETTDIDDNIIKEKTPFNGMKHKEYVAWFKVNRRKKKLLPVFSSPEENVRNYLEKKWCSLRGEMIKKLFQLGLKGGPV